MTCGIRYHRFVWKLTHDGIARYLLQNMDWLDEELGGFEDEYLIIDCPGKSRRLSTCIRGAYKRVSRSD